MSILFKSCGVEFPTLFILTDAFIMKFLISLEGAVWIKASWQVWIVGLLQAGSWVWLFYFAQSFNVELNVHALLQVKPKYAVEEI